MSDAAPIIWLTNSDVSELVSLEDAIEALEEGLALEGRGEARNVAKALGTWGDGNSMHALGSMFPTRDTSASRRGPTRSTARARSSNSSTQKRAR